MFSKKFLQRLPLLTMLQNYTKNRSSFVKYPECPVQIIVTMVFIIVFMFSLMTVSTVFDDTTANSGTVSGNILIPEEKEELRQTEEMADWYATR